MSEKKYSVLVVDDQANWRETLVDLLSEGIDVESTGSYEDALSKIQKKSPPFHVVVTDMRLKDEVVGNVDGLGLLEYIKGLDNGTKAIVVTGYGDVETTKRAISHLGAFDYLEKPIKFDEFQKIVLNAVEEANDIREKKEVEKMRMQDPIDIFVAMPFDKGFEPIYRYISEVADEMHKICKKANQSLDPKTSNSIMADVHYGIQKAEILVVELSGRKPNVLFEAGIGYAWQKKIVFIADEQEKDNIPAILSQPRIVFYKKQLGGETELKNDLKKRFDEEFHKADSTNQNSVKIDPSMIFVFTSPTEDGRDTYNALIKKSLDSEGVRGVYLWDENTWHKLNTDLPKPMLIETKLREAGYIIADLTWDDPTSFYLAGLAYGLRKKYKFLYRKDQRPPFDVAGLNLLQHSKNTDAERENARAILRELIEAYVGEHHRAIVQGSNVKDSVSERSLVKRRNEEMQSKVKVFLNHATEDKPLVRKLYAELKKHPWIDPWIDEERLLPGQKLELEIDKAMKESDAVLVCISNTSVKKTGYVQSEIRKAEEQQNLRPEGAIYMIPVLLEPCKDQVPLNLQKLLWVDISDPAKINSIIKSLETLKK